MAMTPIETIALVLILAFLIKLYFLFTKPRAWLKFAKALYKRPNALTWVALALSIIVGYYLLVELTIVQIMATTAFVTLLIAIAYAPFAKEMMQWASTVLKKDAVRKAWLSILIWSILSLWALWHMFAY